MKKPSSKALSDAWDVSTRFQRTNLERYLKTRSPSDRHYFKMRFRTRLTVLRELNLNNEKAKQS